MKKFSDFASDEVNALIGDKIKIDEVLGKEIKVVGYKISESKYKRDGNDKVLTLQFELEDESRILFTGSNVLMEQAIKYENEMPFLATIMKVNKFYTFT